MYSFSRLSNKICVMNNCDICLLRCKWRLYILGRSFTDMHLLHTHGCCGGDPVASICLLHKLCNWDGDLKGNIHLFRILGGCCGGDSRFSIHLLHHTWCVCVVIIQHSTSISSILLSYYQRGRGHITDKRKG